MPALTPEDDQDARQYQRVGAWARVNAIPIIWVVVLLVFAAGAFIITSMGVVAHGGRPPILPSSTSAQQPQPSQTYVIPLPPTMTPTATPSAATSSTPLESSAPAFTPASPSTTRRPTATRTSPVAPAQPGGSTSQDVPAVGTTNPPTSAHRPVSTPTVTSTKTETSPSETTPVFPETTIAPPATNTIDDSAPAGQ